MIKKKTGNMNGNHFATVRRLGSVTRGSIVDEELAGVQKYLDLHDDIKSSGFENILLMGMGGSSLCPEVLAITFGVKNFHILDSTVPAQVRSVEKKLDLNKTLFIV
ncbi:MAG: hypothetical protein V4692_15095, partial [Bdellovibrionota bacterium]